MIRRVPPLSVPKVELLLCPCDVRETYVPAGMNVMSSVMRGTRRLVRADLGSFLSESSAPLLTWQQNRKLASKQVRLLNVHL